MTEFQLKFDLITWAIMFIAFAVSARSPNIRWLTGTLILIKTIDVLSADIIFRWGSFYYVAISLFDLLGVVLIWKRQLTAAYIANLKFPLISPFALRSSLNYKLTSNEIGIIGILSLSIVINLLSIIEREIRHFTDLNPMFIYESFPFLKFALSGLMLLVLFSVAINGARNIYQDMR